MRLDAVDTSIFDQSTNLVACQKQEGLVTDGYQTRSVECRLIGARLRQCLDTLATRHIALKVRDSQGTGIPAVASLPRQLRGQAWNLGLALGSEEGKLGMKICKIFVRDAIYTPGAANRNPDLQSLFEKHPLILEWRWL